MPRRMAAVMAILVFAGCLVIGGLRADNTFTTTVARALVAMAGTFVISLIVGLMGQRMLHENLEQQEKKTRNSPAKEPGKDR